MTIAQQRDSSMFRNLAEPWELISRQHGAYQQCSKTFSAFQPDARSLCNCWLTERTWTVGSCRPDFELLKPNNDISHRNIACSYNYCLLNKIMKSYIYNTSYIFLYLIINFIILSCIFTHNIIHFNITSYIFISHHTCSTSLHTIFISQHTLLYHIILVYITS